MSLSRRAVLGMVMAATAAFVTAGAGAAQAEPGPDGSYYGSVAVNYDTGEVQLSVNYPDWAASDAAASEICGQSDCEVVARFRDGCAALAQTDDNWEIGYGPRKLIAEQDAIRKLGPLSPPFPNLGSAAPKRTGIVVSGCAGVPD
ncbi:DUF4189 domain-containing protein [Nocardia sp. NPDC050712]|uniref:DUF4189 domain-containing protein n=1 Tax=Nocardia sp. NPDC050712 TaxID=3155518 RepID=UPI0033C8BF37